LQKILIKINKFAVGEQDGAIIRLPEGICNAYTRYD